MKFCDKKTTQKGAIGERIARQHLESKGLVVYEPVTDCAHPFDKLCATRNKRSLMIAEIKTKPSRRFYPDTGIDRRHYDDYMRIQAKYGIDVHLYFVDEDAKKIYGNKLTALIAPRQIFHNGKEIIYPLESKNIIYFPLEAMLHIADITESEAGDIAALSTRNLAYRTQASFFD